MARKRTLGYVQLEWTCPNCNSRNPGGVKTCQNCGAPQPENVQFERAAEEKLVTDEKALKAAAAGADIHCAFCGTRNSATATVCSQCGADLTEGKAREAGRELEAAASPAKVLCTNCGTENPAAKTMCEKCGAPLPRAQAAGSSTSFAVPVGGPTPAAPLNSERKTARKPNWILLGGIGAGLLLCCVAALFLFVFPSSSVQGTVVDVHWQTSVPLQEQHEVQYSDQAGSPPGDAYDISCHTETRQVCEQKTIDQGNGYGEVVEECHDENTDYCSYTVQEWQTIQTYTQEGNDLSPVYASPNLSVDQRAGSASEDLTVVFDSDKGQITYTPDSIQEFQQFEPGSVWTLKLNTLGAVVSVER
jgi:ribosomal protein L40E